MSFASLMDLRTHGDDRFSGEGEEYPWDWLYGGQVVAQALRAAATTVEADRRLHSVHTYFLRSGRHGGVDLTVERLRDGRAFSVREIVAAQEGRVVARLTASFHTEEPGEDQTLLSAPEAPAPETLQSDAWTPLFDHRYALGDDPPRLMTWVRVTEPVADEPVLHACGLAFCTDDLFDAPVVRMLGVEPWRPEEFTHPNRKFLTQSLDCSVWLHRPFRADDWLLLDNRCSTLINACAMVNGNIFDRRGRHVATMAQQVLVRTLP
jgi:acyl-CoA thioesterase II